ncbi:acetate/propionate family kinase [Mesoterricola sediminis]|uniref:Acetate kinase n=1 Tax=Mesoterricola sediminis TaxID=2927980 RepID=A0AA48GXE3_9BACT|nr:acetate kinase [Mesoterricola sediminis]BDU75812.1 acetate kinase [Mesoterricola sediminis]
MFVLVLNAGSSSLKFNLFDMTKEASIAEGQAERIGLAEAGLDCTLAGERKKETLTLPSHREALEAILERLRTAVLHETPIHAVGHRVVHGGPKYGDSVLVTEEVLRDIESFAMYAPLHNPANALGIRCAMEAFPDVPHVAVFDTAFHHDIPDFARTYGIPYELSQKYGIRRYGFHGTSHAYVAARTAILLCRPLRSLRIITCHIGNGTSICAVLNGKSMDTSMGMTPLQGVIMGTRCGTIDPSVVEMLMEYEHLDYHAITTLLNKKSGLLGISGVSSDFREIELAADRGNERARLARDLLTYNVRQFIGSYATVLDGVDAITFTAGIGTHSSFVRAKVCSKLTFLGVKLDPEANEQGKGERIISTPDSRVVVTVVPTNEELMIARETVR